MAAVDSHKEDMALAEEWDQAEVIGSQEEMVEGSELAEDRE
jgi:hypothetical protein